MSIPTQFNPLGTLGAVRVLRTATVFSSNIRGVEATGVTMAQSQHFRTVLDFSIIQFPSADLTAYPKLYSFLGEGDYGRWIAFWHIVERNVYWENNTYRFGAVSTNLSLGAHTAEVTGRKATIDGNVIGTTAATVYETGTGDVTPSFLGTGGFNYFAFNKFDFFVDDELVQRYLPAKKNGVLGLYETVSKTFCKQS